MISELTLTRLAGFKRGEVLRFSSAPVTLGTANTCLVRFDPTWDRTVAAQHATLEWRNDGWWLRDESKTGLWSKGRRLASEEKVSPGFEVELGQGGPRLKFDYAVVPVASAPAVAPVPAVSAETRSVPVAGGPIVSAPTSSSPVGQPVAARPNGFPFGIVAAIAAAVVVLGALGFFFTKKKTGEVVAPQEAVVPGKAGTADEGLAAAAKGAEQAIGLVVVVASPKGGASQPMPFATSWAIGPKVFATNSHVTEGAKEYMGKGLAVYIVINRNADRRYKVTRATSHPKYGKEERNFDGRDMAVGGFDVGLLEIEEPVSNWLKLAPRDELERIDSGYRIAYLGFPMENLSGGGVDPRSPVATMQSGIITSATDWWLSKAPYEKRLLLQHNLGATGGASGSPIFNARGEVVGVLNAGNIAMQMMKTEDGKMEVTRTPSAAMVNFAQRVDLFQDIYPNYGK